VAFRLQGFYEYKLRLPCIFEKATFPAKNNREVPQPTWNCTFACALLEYTHL